jgi:hypothetical protein
MILLVMAGMTVASAISAQLTDAAALGAAFLSIMVVLVAINSLGQK